MKSKFFFFASIFLFLLLAGAVGFGWWYNENFLKLQTEKVNELNTYYGNEFKDIQAKYNELAGDRDKLNDEYQKALADLDACKKNLEAAEKTIADYNAKIEAENKAEEERVKALSEEERAAEKSLKEYNEMVKALKAENEEYAKLYTEVTAYLEKETLTDKERKTFLEKYEKMMKIQDKYKEEHKSEDVSGNA
ncbi:hypothetical protein SAMN02910339_01575 [Lachnospiraceae bacterium YSD2013]|nr:hypothetical protein SAMN02910339_01575 [Lachnospiraceae bacterium YSD2013]